MAEDRKRVLDMLAEGKIDVDEAERLLRLLTGRIADQTPRARPDLESNPESPKYLRVIVQPEGDGDSDESAHRINIRVPMAVLRAGVKLSALIPDAAASGIDRALRRKGIDLDIKNMRRQDVEQLIDTLRELEIDIHTGDQRVTIYIE
ncbi:MAG: hypothetical protein QF744_11750 [SAR202 cluster bacterium]|nr:hypothetical protein [SAR202 cluster bacterium]